MSDSSKRLSNAIIKVIGVGGGGGNAINTMIESGLEGVEFIAANTDIQALQSNKAPLKIQLGRELTKGLGAGANPDVGHDAALEDKAIIQELIGEADMVFVTAGMGGGTGTGAAPVIAQVAREMGALTVGVVTKPFLFEGKKRKNFSEVGIQQLRASVDTLITIPNQRLLAIAPPTMSMLDGFRLADDVLLNAVKGISEIINIPGRINVDFADVKTVMSEMGMALMGTGVASGPNRATEAAQAAISSPLLEDVDIEGATGLLINITGPESMSLHEISVASSLIQEAAHEDANIILGAAIDPTLQDELRVTVIATGFDQAHIAPPQANYQRRMQENLQHFNEQQNMLNSYGQSQYGQSQHGQNRSQAGQHGASLHTRGGTSSGSQSSPSNQPHQSNQSNQSPYASIQTSSRAQTIHSAHTPQPQVNFPTTRPTGGIERPSQASQRMETRARQEYEENRSLSENVSPRQEAERLMKLTMEMAQQDEHTDTEAKNNLGSDIEQWNSAEHPAIQNLEGRAGATIAKQQLAIFEDEITLTSQALSDSRLSENTHSESAIDPLTEKAMQIAKEFADDSDYERPAFLRQNETHKSID